VPDVVRAFVTAGYSGASVARASDATWASAYIPTSRTMTIGLGSFAKPVSGKWFDPRTATYTSITGSPFPNSGTVSVTPPAAGDWVLVFE
jgi:hypothetical protein